MPRPLLFSFCFGAAGEWRIASMTAVAGPALPPAERLAVVQGVVASASGFVLRGATSNARYSRRSELDALAARQEGLGRSAATRAALIPIRKTEGWWALAQDERRAIMEERSRHIAIGLDYLPAVARRLHHGREFGEPFDFLTWFEFAPEHEGAFEKLLDRLRATEEWRYVDHEVDVRLVRDDE